MSPDGRSRAFAAWTGEGGSSTASLEVLSILGKQPQVVHSAPRFTLHAWTREGDLLFTAPVTGAHTPPLRLWSIPSTGGDPRDLRLEMRGLTGIRVSPDGTRLTFTAGFDGGEVRALAHMAR